MANERSTPSDAFEPFIYILNIIFWGPILYTVVVPWLSFAVIKIWPAPILAGYFNAMASTGWLVVSVLVVVGGLSYLGLSSYRYAQKKLAYDAEKAARSQAYEADKAARSQAVKPER